MSGIEYAIVVKGRTRLERLIERFNTRQQARFYIERSGGEFEDFEREHDVFHEALDQVQRALAKQIRNKVVEREFLPSFIFHEDQLVITVGQDGLLANTAKYAKGVPLIGVNPEPARHDGVLLPFTSGTFMEGVQQVLRGRARIRPATLAEARLNDGQHLLAFNDLFIGISDHTSARYRIGFGGREEVHSSSGVLVSTQAGSTGWLSSVFNMAHGVLQSGDRSPGQPMALDADELCFVVREPFLSQRTQVGLTIGKLRRGSTLTIESLMPERGVIFSDGIGSDRLQFNAGAIATIGLAREQAQLVVPGG